jgi:hypothetical protein
MLQTERCGNTHLRPISRLSVQLSQGLAANRRPVVRISDLPPNVRWVARLAATERSPERRIHPNFPGREVAAVNRLSTAQH